MSAAFTTPSVLRSHTRLSDGGAHVRAGSVTVLLVGDDALQSQLLKADLHCPGRVHCEVADSAARALERIARGPVDVVVADLQMAGVDAGLARRIRESDPALPVILLCPEVMLDRAVEGVRAGAADFVPKPVNPTVLLARIERAVNERAVREEIRTARERTPRPWPRPTWPARTRGWTRRASSPRAWPRRGTRGCC